MSNKPQSKGTMRSLADMPKPIIVLEGVGIILLIIVLLATNDYITLPEPLMQPGAIVSMIMVGIGCLVPAMVNIVWRAIHGLSFWALIINNQKRMYLKSQTLQIINQMNK